MSEANVERVRNRIESAGPDFAPQLGELDEQVEWVVAKEHPNSRTLRGPSEILAYFEEWTGMLDELRFDVDEYRDAGDSVLVAGTVRGVGKGGRVPVDVALALLYTFDGSNLVRVEEFLDLDEARGAAGLE